MTNEQMRKLVDDYFTTRESIKDMETMLSIMREDILGLNRATIRGNIAVATVTAGERGRLDLDKVRELLTPAQIMACKVSAPTLVVRVKALPRSTWPENR